MEKTLRKFFDSEVKKADGEERTLWVVASTEDRDRDGDIIVQKSWKLKDFKKNPVILWAHNPSRPPIGKAVDMEVKDGKLLIKIQFVPKEVDPFAEQVFQLYRQGFMKTFSVGFIPYKREPLTEEDKKSRPDMTWGSRLHAELLELSAVPVPSNPQALAQRDFAEAMVKGFTPKDPAAAPAVVSPLLEFRNDDGSINARRLRACVAAFHGARGGVRVPDNEKDVIYEHLKTALVSAGLDVPMVFHDTPQHDLREMFKDVWGEELLDIVSAAEEPEPPAELWPPVTEELIKDAETLIGAMAAVAKDLGAVNAQTK